MKILQSDNDKLTVEMSTTEYSDLIAVVYTANISWGSMDPEPHQLTEERLDRCVKSFDDLGNVGVRKKAKSLA